MLKTLIDARQSRKMTQAQAGAIIGKTQSHYGKIERGETRLDAGDALKLCNAFGLNLSELLCANNQL